MAATASDRRDAHRHGPVIVVTGFMGTGKTETARALAEMLALDFVDTDGMIESSAGMPIAEIFRRHGERYFREIEEKTCSALKERHGAVIATGGGTLLNEKNFLALGGLGEMVLLEAAVDVLCERLSEDRLRPLLVSEDRAGPSSTPDLRRRIEALLAERAPVYRRIPLKIDTTHLSPIEAAGRIAAIVPIPTERFTVDLAAAHRGAISSRPASSLRGRYGVAEIEIGRGVVSKLGERLKALDLDSHAFLLMNGKLRDLFSSQIKASLDAHAIPSSVVLIEDGDEKKNLPQVSSIIDELVKRGAGRDAVVIPVGGGVTGDVGGFVASIFMRGVPLVHVPTTLLAQVDSSIGAKVGVNHPLAKNLIGSFYQPHLVLSDPCTLRTLPLVEISSGMAEVVKSAVIGSEAFFVFLEGMMERDPAETLRDVAFLERCVTECTRIKTRIVNDDPVEQSTRRALNLGHTVGHALEAAAGYGRMKHGQAVSLGLVAALRIASARKNIGRDLLERTTRLLEWCGLPVSFGEIDREAVFTSLRLDKKIRRRRLHFVLPKKIGAVEVVDDVTPEEISAALEKGTP